MNSIKRTGISGIAALIFFTSCSKQIDSVRPDIKNNNISKTTEEVLEYRIDTDKIFDTDKVILLLLTSTVIKQLSQNDTKLLTNVS